MSTKKQTMKMILPALILALMFGIGMTWAAAKSTQVGGLSLVVTTTGTADSSLDATDNVTWDTPDGFDPDYVRCIDELDGTANVNEWFTGMANNTAIHHSGSVIGAYHSNGSSECGIDVDTAGTIGLTYGCLQASESWSCWAVRYAQ